LGSAFRGGVRRTVIPNRRNPGGVKRDEESPAETAGRG
jgi:hypothetical protein